jgi:purine-binding chemotaxis protein CheW
MSEETLGSARLLVFRVGTLACATEVDHVREILPRLPTTRIPGAPSVVAGLVNVRGTLVTVVEGWRALGQAPPTPAAPSHGQPTEAQQSEGSTIILELGGDGDNGAQRLIGFTVDEVLDMLAGGDVILEDRTGLPGVDPTLVRAVGRRDKTLVIVLDVAALLGPILTT